MILVFPAGRGQRGLLVFVVLKFRHRSLPPDRSRKCKNRHRREAKSEDEHDRCMAAESAARQKKYGVAQNAAKARRERPPAGHRQDRRKSRRGETAKEPEQKPPADALEAALRHEAPAEDGERRKQRDRRE